METIDLEGLDALCRVCLSLPDESEVLDVHLIYDEDEQLTYQDCFSICTRIVLSKEDGLPYKLCKSCGLELQMAYDFYKKIEESKRCLKLLQEQQELQGEDIDALQLNEASKEDSLLGTPIDIITEEPLDASEECNETEDILEYQVEELDDAEAVDTEQYDYNIDTLAIEMEEESCDEYERLLSVSRQGQSMSWQQAVVTVANEEHLPLTSDYDSYTVGDETGASSAKITPTSEDGDAPPSPEATITPRKRFTGKFSCEYCNKIFPNHSRMVGHRRSHELDRPRYPCMQCSRMYATKQAMEVHVRAVHTKTGYACPVCDKVYAIKKGLEVHLRYHTGTFPYECSLCGKRFAQICHLNTHTNVRHNRVRFSCEHPDCGKFFTSSASLRNHEFSHGEMPFECRLCQRGYPAKSKLRIHVRRKHGQDMTLDQLECMRKFFVKRTKLNLVRITDYIDWRAEILDEEHADKIEPSEEDKQSTKAGSTANAFVLIKSGDAELPHEPLQPNAPVVPQRVKHKRVTTIRTGPPFVCEQCDHECPTRTLLASHRHRKHRLKENPLFCPKCDKRCDTTAQLERHLKRPTCRAYPEFTCEYCAKQFIGLSNYNIHLRFHKKQYPYVCHLCAKRFMMATHLNTHVKTKHEHQRFICEQPNCGKMFQNSHSLKVHTYVHRDKMPYKCEHCDRMCPTRGKLRWHIKHAHGIEQSLVEIERMLVAETISIKAVLKPIRTESADEC